MTSTYVPEKQTPAILIVEDSKPQAIRYQLALDNIGCQVVWVESGEAGLTAAQERTFDLILLDVELPGINGFEVCRRLKADSKLADVPVIILTTRDSADDALTGLENGAVDYIPKDPFTEMVLVETIKQMGLLDQVNT
jgi:DNA-binding response OmpR family regulator